MSLQLYMWFIATAASVFPIIMLASGHLSVRRDYFFLVVYAQAILYLHVAPTLYSTQIDEPLQTVYLWLQLGALALFEMPFAVIYAVRMESDRARKGWRRYRLVMPAWRVRLVSIVAIAYGLGFAALGVRYSLIFIRIGGGPLLERFGDLPMPIWVAYRLYADAGGFLLSVLLLLFISVRTTGARFWLLLALLVTGGVFGTFVFVNSRLDAAVLIAMCTGVIVFAGRRGGFRNKVPWRPVLLGALLGVYAFKVTATVRHNILVEGELKPEWVYNPFAKLSEQKTGYVATPLALRLNGIDLMARITPRALDDGFALGRAWKNGLLTFVWILTDREQLAEVKRNFMTDSVNYLMARYTNFFSSDYFSSALTDVYGNFGPLGFVLTALFLGLLLAQGALLVLRAGSAPKLIVGLFALYFALPFEHQTMSTVVTMVKVLPMLALVLLVVGPLSGRRVLAPK